jgi:hypothetical protein
MCDGARYTHQCEGRVVLVEAIDGGVRVAGHGGEIELSRDELVWLTQVSGPAVLAGHGGTPRPMRPSPMDPRTRGAT